MFDLLNKKIIVTGGNGFLGSHVVDELKKRGVEEKNIIISAFKDFDLRSREAVEKLFSSVKPDVVFHAAANVGGLGWNVMHPAEIWRDNLLIGVNILDAASRYKIQKLIIIGSACAYPGELQGYFKEKDFLSGSMHPSVEVYGLSKRVLFLGARAYAKEYGLKSVYLIPTNLYGSRDKFGENDSHVLAALVRKFVEAAKNNSPEVVCWGTGAPVREFIYADDAAEGIVRAAERVDSPDPPINLGVGKGITIKELATLIAKLTDYKGNIVWDSSKPDGTMWKVLDTSRMKETLEWEPKTSFEDGIKNTIAWYREFGRAKKA